MENRDAEICPNCKPNFTNDAGAWAGVVSCPYHSLMDEMVEALTQMNDHRMYQLEVSGVTRKSSDVERAKAVLTKARAAQAGGQ